jgi:hypothetical protein
MKEHEDDPGECPECSAFLAWVSEYLEGDATLEVRQELMMHVHSCKQCARLLWSMERLVDVCRAEPGCDMPAATHRQLWETLIRELQRDQDEPEV